MRCPSGDPRARRPTGACRSCRGSRIGQGDGNDLVWATNRAAGAASVVRRCRRVRQSARAVDRPCRTDAPVLSHASARDVSRPMKNHLRTALSLLLPFSACRSCFTPRPTRRYRATDPAGDTIVVTATPLGRCRTPHRPDRGRRSPSSTPPRLAFRQTSVGVRRPCATFPASRSAVLGGPGSQTQVRIRGTEANHVLVLIDGIEVSDPFQGEYRFRRVARRRRRAGRGSCAASRARSTAVRRDRRGHPVPHRDRPRRPRLCRRGIEGGSFGTVAGVGARRRGRGQRSITPSPAPISGPTERRPRGVARATIGERRRCGIGGQADLCLLADQCQGHRRRHATR